MNKINETNIYVMIWIPWVWKSTYIKEFIKNKIKSEKCKTSDFLIVSSDQIRENVYKNTDFNNQNNNQMVFDIVREQIIFGINNNEIKNVIFDATNILKKYRISLFDIKKEFNKKKWFNVKVIAIDLYSNLLEIEKRTNKRNKERAKSEYNLQFNHLFISRDVINTMVTFYNEPTYDEWFDEIYLINNLRNIKRENKDIAVLNNFIENANIDNLNEHFNYLLKNFSYLKEMKWFQQLSVYHIEDLDIHIRMIMEWILIDYNNWILSEYDKKIMLIITIFHDIWKLYTRRSRKDNMISNWKIQDTTDPTIFYNKDGSIKKVPNYLDWQFKTHEKVSWYVYKREYNELLIENNIITLSEGSIIQSIISEHLEFHTVNFDRDNKSTKWLYDFKYLWHKPTNEIRNNILEFDNNLWIYNVKHVHTLYDEFVRLWLLFSKYDNMWRIIWDI